MFQKVETRAVFLKIIPSGLLLELWRGWGGRLSRFYLSLPVLCLLSVNVHRGDFKTSQDRQALKSRKVSNFAF